MTRLLIVLAILAAASIAAVWWFLRNFSDREPLGLAAYEPDEDEAVAA